MMRRLLLLPIWLVSLGAASPVLGQSHKPVGQGYLEIAPLKGAFGQLSARGELAVFPDLAVGVFGEFLERAGDRDDYRDTDNSVGAEAIFYPLRSPWGDLFVGAGLKYQKTRAGRIRTRDSRTWVRMLGDERYDKWVDEGHYFSSTQSIGYRIHSTSWLTSSLRLTSDQVLRRAVSTREEAVFSGSEPLDPKARKRSETRLVMHMGVALP